MPGDKFTATWVSHSSIGDYLKCPRAYYLNNVYKDPATGHKISIISPALALGQIVHEVVESLSILQTEERFKTPLLKKFEVAWKKVTGKKGGFTSEEQEEQYRQRGVEMLKRVQEHPGPVSRLAVKIKMDLPHYWLSEEDEIILCGKIDWLEYLPDTDSVHIIDFKTGKHEEDPHSLQLPIYYLLAHNCQKRDVVRASYWYLNHSNTLQEQTLPDLDEVNDTVLEIAKKIKLARKLNKLACPEHGCRYCIPLEKVVNGEAQFVGVNDFNQDLYMLPHQIVGANADSEIL